MTGRAANNWSGNVLPGAADDVVIDGALTNTQVVLNVGSTIRTLTIDAGDSLSMNNAQNLTLNGGGNALANNGTLAINSGGSNTVLTIQGDTVLGGTGVMNLTDRLQNLSDQSVLRAPFERSIQRQSILEQ